MLSGLVRPGKSISLSRCVSSPGSLLTNQHRLELKMPDADPFAVLDAKAWVSAGLAPSGGSQRGPFLPLPAAGGSRHPSAGDTPLPPLPPFTWLFLHTSVCLLLCLSSSPVTLPTAGPPLQHDLVSSILHALHVQRPLFQTRLPRRPQAMRRIASQGSRQPRRGSLSEGMGPEGPKSSLPAHPHLPAGCRETPQTELSPGRGALLAGSGSGSGVGGWPSRRDLQCHLSIDQLLASLSFLLGENCQCPGLWADRPFWACPRWHRGYRGVDRPTPISDGGQGRYSGFCKVMMRLNRGQLSPRQTFG